MTNKAESAKRTMSASEIADYIGVSAKAFRSFMRSHVKSQGGTVGVETPGSGARYRFECDDADLESWATLYRAHRKTNNTLTIANPIIES